MVITQSATYMTHLQRCVKRRQAAEMVKAGKSRSEVAGQFGRSITWLDKACREAGVSTPRPKPEQDAERARQLLEAGESVEAVADTLKRSQRWVRKAVGLWSARDSVERSMRILCAVITAPGDVKAAAERAGCTVASAKYVRQRAIQAGIIDSSGALSDAVWCAQRFTKRSQGNARETGDRSAASG